MSFNDYSVLCNSMSIERHTVGIDCQVNRAPIIGDQSLLGSIANMWIDCLQDRSPEAMDRSPSIRTVIPISVVF
jgi:hypothetical protein